MQHVLAAAALTGNRSLCLGAARVVTEVGIRSGRWVGTDLRGGIPGSLEVDRAVGANVGIEPCWVILVCPRGRSERGAGADGSTRRNSALHRCAEDPLRSAYRKLSLRN